MIRNIIKIMTVGLILLLSISCTDTTPPEPPFNITYYFSNNLTQINISWKHTTYPYEEVGFLVNYGEEYWNYNGPNKIFSDHFDRRTGVHLIQVKAVDKAGNESETAQLEFEYNESIM